MVVDDSRDIVQHRMYKVNSNDEGILIVMSGKQGRIDITRRMILRMKIMVQ